MNRGRFIGIASLPVLLLGAPNLASEVNTTAEPAKPGVPAGRDAEWAERWKAASAELAARRIAARKAAAHAAPRQPAPSRQAPVRQAPVANPRAAKAPR